MLNIRLTMILWGCILCMCIQYETVVAAQTFFEDDAMVIEGQNFSSSEIKTLLADRYDDISKIYVYLTDTFYGDEDLKLNGISELHIFANIWNITKPVIFDLSNSNGAYQQPAVKGSAGNNGNPGMDGGFFFGLYNQTINGEYITVISNGGDGGDGQDAAPNDDVYALLDVDDNEGNSSWFSNADLHNYYKKYFDDRGYDSELVDVDDYTSFYAVFVHDKKVSFNIRLHPRKCCGTTGMGGEGGHGGQHGLFIFKHIGQSYITNKSKPTIFVNDGSRGKPGKDAKTCENFALDVRIDTELRKVVFIVLPIHNSFSSHFTVVNHTKSSKCLPKFLRNDPPEPTKRNEAETTSSVLRYKRFLIRNMLNSSLTSNIQEMYAAIDGNWELNAGMSLSELVLEASELEKNYFELTKLKIEVQPMYQHLHNRVESLKKRTPNEDEERVSMSHLQKILQFKLDDLQEDYNLILDVGPASEYAVDMIRLRDRRLPAITNVNDTKLQDALNQLLLEVNQKFILAKYYHVFEGFRITYFPFAVDYLEEYTIPAFLTDVYGYALDKLKTLRQTIREIKSINVVMHLNYVDYTSADGALFVWKNSDIRRKIRRLFSGKTITLLADVKQSKKDFNAMKFKTIDMVFRSSQQTVNDRLYDLLKSSFELELNHTGLSTTQCNNKYFNITTTPSYLLTSFQKTEHGDDPVSAIGTYYWLKENQPALSPYSLWKVGIRPVHESFDNFRNITELAPFGQFDFDIELHGTGEYITEDEPICDNELLPKYYSQV